MENAEEVFHFLEEFSKRKPKTIPQELNDYLVYVARTGDPVYQWPVVKSLFKEKLLNVITDFYESTPSIEIPPYPNVDPFNYDIMKNSLLERLDTFTSAPFTVQRICELLTSPRKQYNRVDKFMRAIEKNILVVSTREPGIQRHIEQENGEPVEPMVNGSDNNSEYNVDVEMEDMSWKESSEKQNAEPQPSSSDTHISVDDIEARLQAKQDVQMDTQEKHSTTEYESVTPPEPNITADQVESKPSESSPSETISSEVPEKIEVNDTSTDTPEEPKVDVEMKVEPVNNTNLVIPEIKVDDAEMTEQRLNDEAAANTFEKTEPEVDKEPSTDTAIETQQASIDESSSDSNTKEELEPKLSEVLTSSEESSSSSDHTDGNSNSPKTDSESTVDVQEESNHSDTNSVGDAPIETPKAEIVEDKPEENPQVTLQSDKYSISDVNSELPQTPSEGELESNITVSETETKKEEPAVEVTEETKTDSTAASIETSS